MTPKRQYLSDEARIVDLAQRFEPSYMREYLMWADVWRRFPDTGAGHLPAPAAEALFRGAGIFWEVIDDQQAFVLCFQAMTIRPILETLLEEKK